MAITASGIVGIDPAVLAADFRSLELVYFPAPGFSGLAGNTSQKEMTVSYDYKRHQLYIYAWADPGVVNAGSPDTLDPWNFEGEVSLELQSSVLTRYPLAFNSANTTSFASGATTLAPGEIKSKAAIGGYSLNPLSQCYTLLVDNRNTGAIQRGRTVNPNVLEPGQVYLPQNLYIGQIDKVKVKIDPTKFFVDTLTKTFPTTYYVHIWVGINSYAY